MTIDELKTAIMRLGDDELHTLGLLLEAEDSWWQQRDALVAGLQGIDWPQDDEAENAKD